MFSPNPHRITWADFSTWRRGDQYGCARRCCSLGGHRLVVGGRASGAALTTRRFPPVVAGVNVKESIQTVKFGINYRFRQQVGGAGIWNSDRNVTVQLSRLSAAMRGH